MSDHATPAEVATEQASSPGTPRPPVETTSVTVVQYQTRPDAAEDNHELITQVFAQLHADRPDGVRYAVFRLDDGVSFVHIVSFDGDDTPLTGLPAFMAFQRDIGGRLTGPPTRSGATMVGSYGFIT